MEDQLYESYQTNKNLLVIGNKTAYLLQYLDPPPAPEDVGVECFAEGGDAVVHQVGAWKMGNLEYTRWALNAPDRAGATDADRLQAVTLARRVAEMDLSLLDARWRERFASLMGNANKSLESE